MKTTTGPTVEFGIRDLRNHTTAVIAAVERGDTVHLTKRGRRIATIVPARSVSAEVAELLALIDAQPPYDSGLLDDIRAARADAVERDPWG